MPFAETKTTTSHQSPNPNNPKTHRKPNRQHKSNKSGRRPLVGANLERCIYCNGEYIKKVGQRYKQHEILQRWYCHSCTISFSPRIAGKGSTYPLKIILETLCRFYQGHTIAGSADYIRGRFGLTIHPRTISR
jgi:hypothetical protein